MKIVVAEPISNKLNQLISLANKNWEVYNDIPKDKAEFVQRLKHAEAATSYSMEYDEEIFSACPKLKYLAIPAVGANYYVNMEAAQKHGVVVMNCPGYNSVAVAELAIALSVDVLRKISFSYSELKQGFWNNQPFKGGLLQGKKVGLVGYGNIGKNIEIRLNGWQAKVSKINSRSTAEELQELISTSDIVFVCCPLNEKTKGVISKELLDLMKPTSILVNVSRGAVVDEEALYEKLKDGSLAGAGLDVFSVEPSSSEVPENIQRFVNLPNVVCTPHIAGTSLDTQEPLGQMIFDNLVSAEQGNPVNICS